MQAVKIIPNFEFNTFPVVQPRPFEVFAVQRKSQGFDQVQIGSGGHTGPTDVAGVPMDFGRHEDNMAFGGGIFFNWQVFSHVFTFRSFSTIVIIVAGCEFRVARLILKYPCYGLQPVSIVIRQSLKTTEVKQEDEDNESHQFLSPSPR